MRGTQPLTQRRATPPSPLPQDHPLLAVTGAFSALEGIDDEHPEVSAELQSATAALQDLAWMTRSRIFDGRDCSALRRSLERVSIAVAIVSTRRADASPAGARRLQHALAMLTTTIEASLAMLTRTGTETSADRFAMHPAARRQQLAAEPVAAAEGPLDRAA